MYGICNLSVVPLRLEPLGTSEMINQVVFGEHFEIIEENKNWSKVRLFFDNHEGYIDNKQYEKIPKNTFEELSNQKMFFAGELIDFITDENNNLTTIPLSSHLPFYKEKSFTIHNTSFLYDGKVNSKTLSKSSIIETAFLFLNTPFLSGGKTASFGIDASGLTQTVYKLCGYKLFREPQQQATQGEVLSFIEECEAGDLAFFDDAEGNINHVGIIMNDYNIIHAYGRVRIDKLDHSGIYNIDTQQHTHKLRVIKKII